MHLIFCSAEAAGGRADVNDGGVELAAHSGVGDGGGAAPREGGWSVGSGGRDCARGDVAGQWRADVWNILGGGSGRAVLVMVGSLQSTL